MKFNPGNKTEVIDFVRGFSEVQMLEMGFFGTFGLLGPRLLESMENLDCWNIFPGIRKWGWALIVGKMVQSIHTANMWQSMV